MIWIDAQLSPAIAGWIRSELGIDCVAVREIGLRDSEALEIFSAAKNAGVAVMTKDKDFLLLLDTFGPPPQIIWLTCGNTSNVRLREILSQTLPQAVSLLVAGERLVEISQR